MKICNRCKIEKPNDHFGPDKNSKDGLYSICKECKKQYYEDNKEKITLKHKEYRDNNKGKSKESHKTWYEENKERLKISRRDRYKRNKEKETLQVKEYKNKNIELFKIRQLSYRKKAALYSTYKDKLFTDESPILSSDGATMETKCKYCGKYFKPANIQVLRRIQVLEGQQEGNCFLYCSDACKKACPTYNQKLYPKGFKKATSREVQPELRKLVLERDNWTCQKCGEVDVELHCHHITGVEQNPIESADMDNCLTLCKDCHKVVHKQEGCRYVDLQCQNEYT